MTIMMSLLLPVVAVFFDTVVVFVVFAVFVVLDVGLYAGAS